MPDQCGTSHQLVASNDQLRSTSRLFFLNARRQDCAPFLLVKKEFTSKRSQRSENRSKKKYTIQKYNKRSQAPLKNEARRFAPAIPQARASSLILSGKFMADCSFRWKVHALRSFQISQTTKSIRERNPLRGTPFLFPESATIEAHYHLAPNGSV